MAQDLYTIGEITSPARAATILLPAREASVKNVILCNGKFWSDAEMSAQDRQDLVRDLNNGYQL